MIEALRQAFELAQQKSEEEQAAIAELILEELGDEEHWNELLSHPQSATLLEHMAAQARKEYQAELTQDLDDVL